jgi:hypothetical protein
MNNIRQKPKRDRLSPQQQDIIHRQQRETQSANTWLKQQGIKPQQLTKGCLELVQATKLATNTLKQHGRLLNEQEAQTLNRFLMRANSRARETIALGQCWAVMNIAKATLRRAAQRDKQIKRRIHKLRHARKQSSQGNTPAQTMG